MKFLIATGLLSVSTMSLADTTTKYCDKFSPRDEVSSPLTIDEIERDAMAELQTWRKQIPELPNVLFAYQNSVWLKLKSIHQPGDEIVRYAKDKVAWKGRYSESGIALIRSGCVIHRLVTAQS